MEKSKIFCLGLNKTGTSTLGSCYKILGYKQQGYSLEFSREYFQNGFSPRIQEVISEYDAFQDFPWPLMWKEVVGLYPDAKFILTTRLTPEIWYKSECKHVARTPHSREVNKLVYGSDTPEICKKEYLDYYNNHNQEIRDYFKTNYPERLLEVCWEKSSRWEELCAFLKMPIPEISFPHANSSKVPKEFLLYWSRNNRKAYWVTAKNVLKNPFKPLSYYRDLVYLIRKSLVNK